MSVHGAIVSNDEYENNFHNFCFISVPCGRWWGTGETERCYYDKRIMIGLGRTEKGTKNDPETVETGWEGGARLSVRN